MPVLFSLVKKYTPDRMKFIQKRRYVGLITLQPKHLISGLRYCGVYLAIIILLTLIPGKSHFASEHFQSE